MKTVEAPMITLPENEDLVKRLKVKISHYEARMKKTIADEDIKWKAPEVIQSILADSLYKKTIIEKLLGDGKVNTHELSKEIVETHGSFFPADFDRACSVVNDYCETGGENCYGGDGF
jgi:hypothetical protein